MAELIHVRSRLPAVLAAAVGTILSLLVFHQAWVTDQKHLSEDWRRTANDRIGAFRLSLTSDLESLQSLALFLGASGPVDRDAFSAVASTLLDHHMALDLLAWAPAVPVERRQDFESRIRSQGQPDFQVRRPRDDNGTKTQRPDTSFPLVHVAPDQGHAALMGLDLGAERSWRTDLDRARRTGRSTVSHIDLEIAGEEESSKFLLFLPVYRRGAEAATARDRMHSLVGFVIARLDLSETASSSIRHLQFEDHVPGQALADIYVYDHSAPRDRRQIYPVGKADKDPETLLAGTAVVETVPAGDREWLIIGVPGAGISQAGPSFFPYLYLVAGLTLTALLTVYLTFHARRTAEQMRVATDLMRSEARLKESERIGRLGHWERNLEDNSCFWSGETRRILGIDANTESPTPNTFLNHLHPDDQSVMEDAERIAIQTGRPFGVNARIIQPDGSVRYARIRGEVSPRPDGTPLHLRGTLQDVTEVRHTELELRQIRDELEERVRERTRELAHTNERLMREIGTREEVEAALRREKNRAEEYLAVSEAIIVGMDQAGTVVTINRRGCLVLEGRRSEILGKNWLEVFIPDSEKPRVGDVHRRLMAGEISPVEYFENTVVTLAGERRTISWHNTVVRNDGGEIIGTLSSGTDVTERRLAERAIQESERKFRNLFESANDFIFIVDFETRAILVANDIALSRLGYPREDMLRLTFEDISAPDTLDGIPEILEQLDKTGHVVFEHRHLKKNGTEVPVEISSRTVDYGGRKAILSIARDITERKRAEAELRRQKSLLQSIFDAVPDALVMTGPERDIVMINPGVTRIFGYDSEDLVDHKTALLYADGRDYEQQGKRQLITSAKMSLDPYEIRYRRKSGATFFGETVGTTIRGPDGSLIGYLGVIRDITERKQTEHSLITAKAEAEKADAAKTKFLASASHDLRQPVHAISLFVGSLLKRPLDDDTRNLAHQISSSVEAFEYLLNSLLHISRLDAGVLKPSPADFLLAPLITDLGGEFAHQAADKGIEVRVVPFRTVVHTDRGLLARILRNLLSNAVRHTKNGKILIGCRRRSGSLAIQVLDTGEGIPEDQQNAIFREFFQLGNPQRDRRQGLGLGLAIVERLGRLLGHEITVASNPGRGSCFSVTVPLGTTSPKDLHLPEPVAAVEHALEGTRIAVIEDDIDVLEATRNLLEDWGCSTISGGTADIVLDAMEKWKSPPDLVIADYRLPQGHTGVEAIDQIRARFEREVPGIIITGDTAPDRIREATEGGYKLVYKPLRPARLRSIVTKMLQAG